MIIIETVGYGKKRYFILLALYVIATLILPLLRNLFSFVAFLNHSTDSNVAFSNIVYHIGDFSAYAGSAVLIFAAIRYRFKLCLPFVAVAILENVVALTVALMSNGIQTFSISYSIIYILLAWALPFTYIGIAKASAKYLKKKFIVILVTLLGMLIVSLFVNISLDILSLILSPVDYPRDIYLPTLGLRAINIIRSTITSSLREYLFITAAYLIIRLIFTDNKREKFLKILSITKTTAKRLWESTAK